MRGFGLTVLLMTFALVAHAGEGKIAVLDVQTTGVEAQVGPLFTEILTAEVDAAGRFSQVIAGRDIETMLGFEKQKEILGCNDAACIAEIGGALGVDHLVVGSVGRIGSVYVINIKLIDIKRAVTERRVYETVNSIEAVITTMKSSVRRLFDANAPAAASAAPAQSPTPATAPTPTPPSEPPAAATAPTPAPAPTVIATPARVAESSPVAPTRPEPASIATSSGDVGAGPIVLWIIGGVSLAVGGVFGILTASHRDHARDTQYVGGQREIEAGKMTQTIANIGFGVGGASLITGFIVWLASDSPAKVAAVPLPGGASVALAVSY